MLNYNTSLWEKESFLRPAEVAIIGGGIVGINAAISLKERNKKTDVLVIERNTFPLGASTRNAGFACFGSVTELLDDLSSNSESEVFRLLAKRKKGLELLKKRVGERQMNYRRTGSFEMFDIEDEMLDSYREKVPYLNQLISEYAGLENTFQVRKESNFTFKGFHQMHIFNQHEGQLHPGKMMKELYEKAQNLGVRFLMGHGVDSIDERDSEIALVSAQFEIRSEKVIICTNGFTNKFLPELRVLPARSQVLVTREIPHLDWQACFHYDKGYVYFRNVGKRILLGGGRNIRKKAETTEVFDITPEIEDYLMKFLKEKIGINVERVIEYKWSGILGVGEQKSPIIKKHSERIILAVRLGGMGVALGTLVGNRAAELTVD